jgi:cytochrome c oxidase subunit I+III
MIMSVQGFFMIVMLFMGLYTVARAAVGLLHAQRRATFDNTMLFWYYTVAQGIIGLALVHSFPRLVG